MADTVQDGVRKTNDRMYAVMLGIAVFLIAFAAAAQPDGSIFSGFWAIQLGECGLITDPIVTGGVGAALLNAGVMLLASTLLLRLLGLPFTGLSFACLFMMAGFALLGKNLVNTLPILAGGWLYARFRREPFSKYVCTTLFGTCLSPMVSYLLNHMEPGVCWAGMAGCGVVIGFLVPAVSTYTPRIHQGYNLYNVGVSAGFVGLGVASVLKGFGVTFATESTWSQPKGPLLDVMMWLLLGGLAALGVLLGCRSVRAYRRLLSHSGRAVTDFVALEGPGPALVNMGLVGMIGLAYLRLAGVGLNGPLICCVFAMTGFAAFGKHPRNVLPVMAGAVLCALVMGDIPLTAPGTLLATLLCTGLAPVAGQFGWYWGMAAGFLHMAIVQHTSFLHGGMNLYNNGFAAGLTCVLMIPLIEALRPEPKE